MTMNAVVAARTVDYDDSLALDPFLRCGIAARDVYRLGAELAFGRETTSATMTRILEQLKRGGSAMPLQEALKSDRLDRARLNDNHKAALAKLTALAADDDVTVQDAIEKAFVEDGNGVPAIAILILLVVVVVAVIAAH